MSDRAVGIAILDAREQDQMLYFTVLRESDGAKHETFIPISLHEKEHAWKYRVVGDTLHLTPSARINNGQMEWHTDYEWSVRFVCYDHAHFKNVIEQHAKFNEPTLPRMHD